MRVAEEVGVPVPRSALLEGPPVRVDAGPLADFGFPLVLKPARSAISTDEGVRKFGVTIVTDADHLREALRRYPPKQPTRCSSRSASSAPAWACSSSRGRGATLAAFAHRRIREKPPTGGVSVYREAVAVAPDLREYSERLLARFHWRGAAMVEFKQDARTGVSYLMEINGRLWGSLQLAIDAGVDFPRMLVGAALGERQETVDAFREGVRCRWLWGDVDHLLWMLKTPRAVRAAHPDLPGRLGALARFLLPWRPGDRFEVLRPTDLGPFFRESANWFRDLPGHR